LGEEGQEALARAALPWSTDSLHALASERKKGLTNRVCSSVREKERVEWGWLWMICGFP